MNYTPEITHYDRAVATMHQINEFMSQTDSPEKKQAAETLARAFFNIYTETNEQTIVDIVQKTTTSVGTIGGRIDIYWQDFLAFANYKKECARKNKIATLPIYDI